MRQPFPSAGRAGVVDVHLATPRARIRLAARAVATASGVGEEALRVSSRRARPISSARREFVRKVREMFPDWSLARLSRALGLHPSSVRFAVDDDWRERRAERNREAHRRRSARENGEPARGEVG